MIPYENLVASLTAWRQRMGLAVSDLPGANTSADPNFIATWGHDHQGSPGFAQHLSDADPHEVGATEIEAYGAPEDGYTYRIDADADDIHANSQSFAMTSSSSDDLAEENVEILATEFADEELAGAEEALGIAAATVASSAPIVPIFNAVPSDSALQNDVLEESFGIDNDDVVAESAFAEVSEDAIEESFGIDNDDAVAESAFAEVSEDAIEESFGIDNDDVVGIEMGNTDEDFAVEDFPAAEPTHVATSRDFDEDIYSAVGLEIGDDESA